MTDHCGKEYIGYVDKIMKIIGFIPFVSFIAFAITLLSMRPNSKQLLKIFGLMLPAIPVFIAVSLLGFVIPEEIADTAASLSAMWTVGFALCTYAIKEKEKSE